MPVYPIHAIEFFMPDLLVSRLIKPLFLSLMLFALLHPIGREACAEVFPEKSEGPIITDTTIKNGTTKRLIKNIDVQIKNATENVRIHPRTIDITIIGPPLDPTTEGGLKNDIVVYIDIKRRTSGICVKPARVVLPGEYVMIEATPEIFIVEIKPESDRD